MDRKNVAIVGEDTIVFIKFIFKTSLETDGIILTIVMDNITLVHSWFHSCFLCAHGRCHPKFPDKKFLREFSLQIGIVEGGGWNFTCADKRSLKYSKVTAHKSRNRKDGQASGSSISQGHFGGEL